MNTRKTEKMTNSRLFNKGILPVAVATAMFGAQESYQLQILLFGMMQRLIIKRVVIQQLII